MKTYGGKRLSATRFSPREGSSPAITTGVAGTGAGMKTMMPIGPDWYDSEYVLDVWCLCRIVELLKAGYASKEAAHPLEFNLLGTRLF
jgi:hypothetical protein